MIVINIKRIKTVIIQKVALSIMPKEVLNMIAAPLYNVEVHYSNLQPVILISLKLGFELM